MILFRMKNEIAYSILKIKLRIIVFIIYIFRITIIYYIRKVLEEIITNILVSATKFKKFAFNRIILQIYNNKI